MKTLLTIAATVAICSAAFNQNAPTPKTVPPVPVSRPAPQAERAFFIPVRPAAGEWQLVQGHVMESFRDGVIVRCEDDPPATSDMSPGLITATSGAGDIRAAAGWAVRARSPGA